MASPALIQQLTTLQAQQAGITSGLHAMLEGRWLGADFGADSLEAILYGLNPTWTGQISAKEPLYNLPEPPPGPEANPEFVGSPNHYYGRYGYGVVALVIHTMAGTLESCDAWFNNPSSQVSSHYGIGLAGEQHQYVKLADGSWANGIIESPCNWQTVVGHTENPNFSTVSVETEDNGSGATPVTDAQYNSTLAVCRLAKQTYPSIAWLLRHTDISPRSRPSCCGDRWVESGRFDDLAEALGLETTF